MFWGKIARVGVASARIIRIDTQAAEALDGVMAVVTAKDVPGLNGYGIILEDQEVFSNERIRFEGDAVAGVVATTPALAEEAAKLIKIEYEETPGVYNVDEAIRIDAPKVHDSGNVLLHGVVKHGDVQGAFRSAAVVVEESYELPMQEHAYLETEGGIAEYKDGEMSVFVGSQYPWQDQRQLCKILDMDKEQVHVVSDPVGGAFGGRESLTIQAQLAVMALKVDGPVKMVNSREESIITSWKRHPMRITMKTAADAEGVITANQVRIYSDTGAYAGLGKEVLGYSIEHACGAYRVKNVDIEGYSLYTNNAPACAMRAFGVAQSTFAMESQVEMLADKLGMDPLQMRLTNGLVQGDVAPFGHTLRYSMGTIPTLKKAAEVDLWLNREKHKAVATKPWKKRGVGIATEIQAIGIGQGAPDFGAADLVLTGAGRLSLGVGCPDIGQGNNMVFRQMAAELLGCDLAHMDIIQADTKRTPDAGVTAASRTTYTVGNAVVLAANTFKEELKTFAQEQWGQDIDILYVADGITVDGRVHSYQELASLAGELGRSVSAHGHFDMPEAGYDSPLHGLPHIMFGAATHVAMVEVDTLTGQVELIRSVVIPDTGRTINIQGVEGQAEGGTLMGMGYALMESVISEKGHILSDNLNTYLIPTAMDIPEVETYPVEEVEETGPFGAKGIGEAVCAAATPAIINAIYDAVQVRIKKLPANPEAILTALVEKEGMDDEH
jgi:CO/xanthine dehydrogenase Mo-binding subunit